MYMKVQKTREVKKLITPAHQAQEFLTDEFQMT